MATATPSPSAVSLERAAARSATAAHPTSSNDDSANAERVEHPENLRATLQAVAAQIESYLKSIGRELLFTVDEETNRTVVTVRDPVSGETIRQIPSEELLRIARALGAQQHSLIDLQI
ncbi:MAG: flagellar protein FlaG [Steroidobacteraceae bacterium]|nr:flagellar protein FlaG [Steroidobacteraceae bacterium]